MCLCRVVYTHSLVRRPKLPSKSWKLGLGMRLYAYMYIYTNMHRATLVPSLLPVHALEMT